MNQGHGPPHPVVDEQTAREVLENLAVCTGSPSSPELLCDDWRDFAVAGVTRLRTKRSSSTIMVVDDIPENLKLLQELLDEQGYKVMAFPCGDRALQAAARHPPDLILLDIRMPEMDGYEVCRRLKADERLRDIPVLFISAMNEVEDKVRAFAQGGLDYVTKPFQADEVLARVQCLLRQRRLLLELEAQRKCMEELARTDCLTGLLNRRAFMEILEQGINRQQRYGNPLSLLMADLDHFKKINDTRGHAGGDEVLRHFAKMLCETIRKTDIPGRLGGEEFVVLLPESDTEQAVLLAQRLCQAIRSANVSTIAGVVSYTVSIGVSQMRSGDSSDTLLERADQSMYRAKESGRDRVDVV